MKTFVTSDLHFGHSNIIRYCGRPFKSASHMNTELVRRWNSRVTPEDTVYFLGDFAMGPNVDANFIVAMLQSLNGELFILMGNHDQPNKKHKQLGLRHTILSHELGHINMLSDIYELTHEGTSFVMCHYPLNDWNGKFHGSVHLHGHKHTGPTARKISEAALNKRYDIGVDMYGGPVQLTGDLRYLDDPQGWDE